MKGCISMYPSLKKRRRKHGAHIYSLRLCNSHSFKTWTRLPGLTGLILNRPSCRFLSINNQAR
jgi:hypothetical protein